MCVPVLTAENVDACVRVRAGIRVRIRARVRAKIGVKK